MFMCIEASILPLIVKPTPWVQVRNFPDKGSFSIKYPSMFAFTFIHCACSFWEKISSTFSVPSFLRAKKVVLVVVGLGWSMCKKITC